MNGIESFKSFTWCNSYIQYVELRKKGLRKAALKSLDCFISDYQTQNKDSRRAFINRANEVGYHTGDYSIYLPVNLYNLFEFEIKIWIKEEPYNPIPLIWTRDITSLKNALNIDPTNQTALTMFGCLIIGKVSMNQHELESGLPYDGNPSEDIGLINYFLSYTDNLRDIDKRDAFVETLNDLKKQALNNLSR